MNKYIAPILIVILTCCSACGQKMPVPTSSTTGALLIPAHVTNRTRSTFGYYYSLLYSPDTPTEITFHPYEGKQFLIVANFPAGEYKIHSVKTLSSAESSRRGGTESSSRIRQLPSPISFTIRPKQVTLLSFVFKVKSEYVDPHLEERYRQRYQLHPLSDDQLNTIMQRVKETPNSELWKFSVPAVNTKTIDPKIPDKKPFAPSPSTAKNQEHELISYKESLSKWNGTSMSPQEIRTAFSNKTVEGYHVKKKFSFKRYYAEDGTLTGISDKKRVRKDQWKIAGEGLCEFFDEDPEDCKRLERDGKLIVKFNSKGKPVIIYILFHQGNQL